MLNQLLGEFHFNTLPKTTTSNESNIGLNSSDSDLATALVTSLINRQPLILANVVTPEQLISRVSQIDHELIESIILKKYLKTFSNDPHFSLTSRIKTDDQRLNFIQKKEIKVLSNYKISKQYDVLITRIQIRQSKLTIINEESSFKRRGTAY